jgi:predicted TIM-barrel fold metal-dependent hydrolase
MTDAPVSRRSLLRACIGGVTAAALAAAGQPLCALAAAGADARDAASTVGRIDTHHHLLPPGYLEQVQAHLARTMPSLSGLYAVPWSPQRSLEEMDRNGIGTAVLSVSSPGLEFATEAQAAGLARLCNEYAARMRRDHPGRFGSFAVLPLPHVDRSLAELEYALDVLGADGVGLMTSYGERWPGDARFAPVFDELDRRGAVVYFHPTTPACCLNTLAELPPPLLEFPFDTTRAIASLLYNGAFTRWPRIRWIFSHGGGALPAVHSRLIAASLRTPGDPRFPQGATAELRKLHYDLASVTNAPSFAALQALVPPTQILFGTDFPLGPPVAVGVREFEALALDPEARRMIERDNALRLLPRLG